MSRSDAPLTRSRIARHALAIVDRDGVDGLSMRRLAGQLEVTPMALYNHVEDRRALLDDVAELVLAEVAIPSTGLWRDRLEQIINGLRACYLRHPRALPLVLNASRPSSVLLAPMEAGMAALVEAGLDQQRAVEMWATLVALATGFASYQLGGHLGGTPPVAVDAATAPHVAAVAETALDWDAAFGRAVSRQLSALAQPAVP